MQRWVGLSRCGLCGSGVRDGTGSGVSFLGERDEPVDIPGTPSAASVFLEPEFRFELARGDQAAAACFSNFGLGDAVTETDVHGDESSVGARQDRF